MMAKWQLCVEPTRRARPSSRLGCGGFVSAIIMRCYLLRDAGFFVRLEEDSTRGVLSEVLKNEKTARKKRPSKDVP